VRWSNLEVEAEQEAVLPGYRDPATVRRFDAPEALNTRFYEVRAKSALNRVPEQSQMPFRWTVNPYRGCTHACTYCMAGDTPILMGDGTTRALESLSVGDEIYGTRALGRYRRYVKTEVLAHWTTSKPSYRLTLEDGTEVVASGDHRFLTDRGWKYVTGREQAAGRRPHLSLKNKLIGTGHFDRPPTASAEYRRGYLCGMIRGDGHVGSYSYASQGGAHGDVHRFRLALADLDGLRRSREYLGAFEIETQEFAFYAATPVHRAITAIRTSAEDKVELVRQLIRWPRFPSRDWSAGFLAGIFDAEGSFGQVIRICNTDDEIIDQICAAMRVFGIPFVVEDRHLDDGLRSVRVTGGLTQALKFLHIADPAIRRKRSIEGRALKSTARLGVVAIEPMGAETPLYDITTGTGDFIANGVVSHNCFARPTHTFLGFDAGRDFEREIVVKVNVPERLRVELSRPKWKREHVALGTNTDPYQWVEGRYKLMPGIWEALRDARNPCSVLTKSPLLLRDIALLRDLVDRAGFTACLSVPTLDEAAWRASEPRTPNPRARLEAVAELNRAGVPTGILIAPLMPGINDDPRQVEKILSIAGEAGAVSIGGTALHLRGEVRGVFMDWLRSYRPDLVPRYESLYARSAYAPQAERRRLGRLIGAPWPPRWRDLFPDAPSEEPQPANLEVTQASLF
jgi:DNA repair photolyase